MLVRFKKHPTALLGTALYWEDESCVLLLGPALDWKVGSDGPLLGSALTWEGVNSVLLPFRLGKLNHCSTAGISFRLETTQPCRHTAKPIP